MADGSIRGAADLSVTIASVTVERQLMVRAVVVSGLLVSVVGVFGCISA